MLDWLGGRCVCVGVDGHDGGVVWWVLQKNAVDFLLQPCSFLPLYIPRRMKHSQDVEVPKGSTVLWRFTVADGLDIIFSMAYKPT